ncbi:outer membrane protein OmpA-like peptidoglycan-associated protein [Endobacter medicaginis]|uniref:OmpA family protein n=1 Tax=Endobacter medicaginis TaxID=1181271 RepID=A0A839V167_9PROT|nr:OmpA family protein [Endobacter medicaginis]MBB3174190.1 outer membrane protein OmpA-like peptidoglycan-associated protein [Endobacter medicaginis]MCX5474235.1 OmpA family protein [Endobacter medicaginis]NVN31519.1 OmpA family protein [Endobacter medicaginis]
MRRWAMLFGLTVFSGTMLAGCADDGPGRRYVVFFSKGSAGIDTAADRVIRAAATAAAGYPASPVTVAGYAAANGSRDAEEALVGSRIAIVSATLRIDGVDPARIVTQPRPPSNETPTVGARRVEITIGAAP